jgi:hypothetical protein
MVGPVTWAMGLEPSPDIGWEIIYAKGHQREGDRTINQESTVSLPPQVALSSPTSSTF